MELHSQHKTIHYSHRGEEKQQMLILNRRLETYLNRLKYLEDENALLTKEIQVLQQNEHGTWIHRKGLEEELQHVRQELDIVWKDRDKMEFEVDKLKNILQALDLQMQREAQAKMKVKTQVEQTRKELAGEERALMWFRQKVHQLEQEMKFVIQTHEEDVAHFKTVLVQSTSTVTPTPAQRGGQIPNILLLEQEYSQNTTRAQQEAMEVYQGHLVQMEESLNQAKNQLIQVRQGTKNSQMKLQSLEKEVACAQDMRKYLEKTIEQQRCQHQQETVQFQKYMDSLEGQKVVLDQQIDDIVLDKRDLQQKKMTLRLEVTTYRALLDSENLRGDDSVIKPPRNIYIKDAVFSPLGLKESFRTQQPTSHTHFPSVHGITGKSKPVVITAMPTWNKNPISYNEALEGFRKPVQSNKPTKLKATVTGASTKTKILQNGAAENFRPQEVHDNITYAEALSPPNEHSLVEAVTVEKDDEKEWSNVESPKEENVLKGRVSNQVESGQSNEPPLNDEVVLTPYYIRRTEKPASFICESVSFEMPTEKVERERTQVPMDVWVENKCSIDDNGMQRQEEICHFESEAVFESNSRSSHACSKCESEGSEFNGVTDRSRDENVLCNETAVTRQEINFPPVEQKEAELKNKFSPDGEELDSWGSGRVKTGNSIDPEENVSTFNVDQDQTGTSSVLEMEGEYDGHYEFSDEVHMQHSDNEDDEQEESQNVSVSWKTELETDNTLADTRPLIRYKSDETEGNSHALQMDESESSDNEQEDKNAGEIERGIWNEVQSRRFGTMEDLCEEAEGESLDEKYNLEYLHSEDRDEGRGVALSDNTIMMTEGALRSGTVRQRQTVESKYDVEVEELENLPTNRYRENFTQQAKTSAPVDHQRWLMGELHEAEVSAMEEQTSAGVHQISNHMFLRNLSQTNEVQHKQKEQDDTEKVESMDKYNRSMVKLLDVAGDSNLNTNQELAYSSISANQLHNHLYFSKPEPGSYEKVQGKHQEGEEDKQLYHFGMRKDHYTISTHIPGIGNEENLHNLSVSVGMEEVAVVTEDAGDFHEELVTDEGATLQTPMEAFELDIHCDSMAESVHTGGSNDGNPHTLTPYEEPKLQDCHEKQDMFLDSVQSLNKSGKSNDFDFFSTGVNDMWVVPMDKGATFRPDDSFKELREQLNQDLGFENLVSDDSERLMTVMRRPRTGVGSEQEQVLSEHVVHSDESEDETETMLMGQEPRNKDMMRTGDRTKDGI